MDRSRKKYPDAVLLLRKSVGGQVPVLKRDAFPMEFQVDGSVYRIDRTRAGKILMTKPKTVA